MRYRLRTLLIVLALGPPLVAGAWFGFQELQAEELRRQRDDALIARIAAKWVQFYPGLLKQGSRKARPKQLSSNGTDSVRYPTVGRNP
jgi:hypothetical protein